MAKLKLNPVTNKMDLIGIEESDLESALASVLDLIDNAAPSATTVSSSFATLLSSASTAFTGGQVLFMLNLSALLSVGTNTEVEFAIQIDAGSDVVIASHLINELTEHYAISGTLIQTLVEGDHTINLRWRRVTGTGTVSVDASDRIQLKAIQF